MKQTKTNPNIFYGGSLEEFWERTKAFHKKHKANCESRNEIKEKLNKLTPKGMIATAEIDSALSFLHKKDRNEI
jgi:hypothetical protein